MRQTLAALSAVQPDDVLRRAIDDFFEHRLCIVSAFGVESAVLLDLVARIDRSTPVLFVDTGRHFPETLAYRDLLVDRLKLSDVRSVGPAQLSIPPDPVGTLVDVNADACCAVRKVDPLDDALQAFDCWVTGRKRFQGGARQALAVVEEDGSRLKLNPLAHWTAARIDAYFDQFGLPRHPLWALGYRSVGCAPCTAPSTSEEDPRAGRWKGQEKTECGIHRPSGRAA